MKPPGVRRALFACDGAVVPAELWDGDWAKRGTISTRDDDPDFRLVLEGLARKVVGRVQPRARDLIRIGACCYAADLRLPRDGIDVDRVRWRREFELWITVDEPAFWGRADVLALLEEALGFVTEDTWRFRFQGGPPWERDLRIEFAEEASARTPDTVVLFSGGSDSLCALVEALRNERREPVVVSHWPAGQIKGHQDALLRAVEERFRHWDIPHASFRIHRSGTQPVESSQRTRGFLYACLGAAIAAQHGVAEVRLADNGYVSVNPPITDQLVGALASRGTHPKFLQLANRLLAEVFATGVHLTNPLWNKTRAEALKILADAGCADLLAMTYTCGKQQGQPKGKPLCGGCSQCVDRRIAAIAADLEAHDPLARYDLDFFTAPLTTMEARTIGVAFVRFADETAELTPDELWDRLPQLDLCVDPDDAEYKKKAAGIPAMLIRHAQETTRVVDEMGRRAKADGSYDGLEATALLRLWAEVRPRRDTASSEADARFGVEVVDYSSSFLREGGVWIVKFRHEKGHYKHYRGMTQLALLLEHEKQLLDVIALDDCRAVHAPKPMSHGELRAELVRRQEGIRSGYGGDLGHVLTEISEDYLKEHVALYTGWIEDARAKGDRDEVRRLKEEEALGKHLLRAARNRRGERRTHGGKAEQSRKNVSGNIRDCYVRFAARLPEFVKHANRFVHVSIPSSYDPDQPEGWVVKR